MNQNQIYSAQPPQQTNFFYERPRDTKYEFMESGSNHYSPLSSGGNQPIYKPFPLEKTLNYNQSNQVVQNFPNANLRIQNCDLFQQWEEVKTLVAIARDLNIDENIDESRMMQAAAQRAKLYLNPRELNPMELRNALNWSTQLWSRLNRWAAADPLHQRIVKALKVMYYQSQVRLEDYFMDKGYSSDQATGLAIATLQTLVGYHLQRFV